jgi:hypothetical protein
MPAPPPIGPHRDSQLAPRADKPGPAQLNPLADRTRTTRVRAGQTHHDAPPARTTCDRTHHLRPHAPAPRRAPNAREHPRTAPRAPAAPRASPDPRTTTVGIPHDGDQGHAQTMSN